MFLDAPSPMSLPLRRQTEATMIYDYTPTPMGVHIAAEEALKQAQMIAPSPEQLALVSERRRLPEDEKQLHSLLMIEGDLTAGELDVPIEWLEMLAHREQVKYIEPGLWIAAENAEKYAAALEGEDKEARLHIVLRLLRYRGAWSPEQVGERYFWSEKLSLELLTELFQQGSIVENDGLYYHAELYDWARRETIKSRRRQIKTLPAQCYAALLANRVRITAPPSEQLEKSLRLLCGQSYQPALWESIILPTRVKGYRPELLDTLLAQGNMFWHITQGLELSFHSYEDIDWDADMSAILDTLEGNEKTIYETLLKRGASFMQRLSSLIEGASPYDTLIGLTEKGLVCADSFLPVRQWINKVNLQKGTVRQRITARSKAMTSGRWELTRPLKPTTIDEQLERNFDGAVILCRETVQGLTWGKALETLRVWEYTGRVRRGYFIERLSGIQFIREKDFVGTMQQLEQPSDDIIWMSAVDPAQPWGKTLPHIQDRSFLNIAGNVVALRAGIPIAIFERQGKVFRVFEDTSLLDALSIFTQDYTKRRLFSTLNRLVVKQYPREAAEVFTRAGFIRELQDYVLYRGIQ